MGLNMSTNVQVETVAKWEKQPEEINKRAENLSLAML